MGKVVDTVRQIAKNTWVKVPYLPSIEQYVETGDSSALAKVIPANVGYYWGSDLAAALRTPDKWEDDDRRAVHVLAAVNFENAVWQWLNGQIHQEVAGQDFHKTVVEQLQVGREQKSTSRDTICWMYALQNDHGPNSAGRYLLSLSEDQIRAAVDELRTLDAYYCGAVGSFTKLLLDHRPQAAASLAADLLACEKDKGASLPVVSALLDKDKEKYAAAIVKAMQGGKDTMNAFYVAQRLHDSFGAERFKDLVLKVSRAALAGASSNNNYVSIADFMMKNFGKATLSDILSYFNTSDEGRMRWQQEILKQGIAVYGAQMLPAVLAALEHSAAAVAKLGKPTDYQGRWSLKGWNTYRAQAMEHLIAINDGSQDARIQKELELGLSAGDGDGVVTFLNLAGKWDVKRIMGTVWGLLEHKSKPVREAAGRVLARGGDEAVAKAEPLLAHKKADVRMAAAYLMTAANTPKALELLEARVDKESNDDVRDQMLLGLEEAWAKQGRAVTRKDVDKRIKRTSEKLDKPIVSWLKEDQLPELKWTDGSKVSAQAVRYLLYRQSRAKEIKPDIEAKAMYNLIDRESSGDFAKAVLAGFLGSKQDAADRWALVVACRLGDDRLVPALSAQIKEWVEANRGKLAEYAVQALALLGSDAALLTVDAMAIRYRSKMKNVGKAATEAFEGAAEALGITPEELGDRVVPWLGFEPGKQRIVESSGGGKFEVSIGMDFKLAYKDLVKNKPAKSLPKSCPAEVLADLKEASANLREALKSQLLRLENLLVRQRRWPAKRWKELFLAHPLLLPFAVKLVWGHFDEAGKRLGLFRALEDRTLTTEKDEAYTLGDSGQVGMVHPLELDDATRQAWQTHQADYEIEPPFAQLERKVVRVAAGDEAKRVYKDLEGKSLNAMTFKGRAERLGWHRGSVCDGGGITSYVKNFPMAGTDVILGLEDMYIGIDMYSDVHLGEVMFVRGGSVKFGSYTYDEPSKEDDARVLKFGEVPPIVFSEAMGDLEKIAGKTDGEVSQEG